MRSFGIHKSAAAYLLVFISVVALSACGSGSEPEDLSFDLEIKDRKLTIDVFKARQGDTITFNIKSDVLGDLHLHGYNHHAELEPGGSAAMKFVADAAGKFVIMLHVFEEENEQEGSHDDEHADETAEVRLATLEVHPR